MVESLVQASDFNELKEIVHNLAQARTEARVDTLAVRMEELAQAGTSKRGSPREYCGQTRRRC